MTTTIFTETFKTTDYDTLLSHDAQPENRAKPSADLIQSLVATNGNHLMPILVSEHTKQIIDGHRRIEVCKNANLPVYYKLMSLEDEEKWMGIMNSTARIWTTANFINHFGSSDKNYRTLADFLKKGGASVEMFNLFSKGVSYASIRNGSDISSIDYDYIEKIRRAVIFIAGKFDVRSTNSMRALKRAMKEVGDIDTEELVEKIELAHERGDYQNISFITTDAKLTALLVKTYKSKLKKLKN